MYGYKPDAKSDRIIPYTEENCKSIFYKRNTFKGSEFMSSLHPVFRCGIWFSS